MMLWLLPFHVGIWKGRELLEQSHNTKVQCDADLSPKFLDYRVLDIFYWGSEF